MERRYKVDYEVIGKRIKQGRKLAGLTQSKLAELVHITASQIAKLETNRTAASFETMVNIANALDLDINCLLTDESYEQSPDYIELLIASQLKNFNVREKEALLLVVNAMKACKNDDFEG